MTTRRAFLARLTAAVAAAPFAALASPKTTDATVPGPVAATHAPPDGAIMLGKGVSLCHAAIFAPNGIHFPAGEVEFSDNVVMGDRSYNSAAFNVAIYDTGDLGFALGEDVTEQARAKKASGYLDAERRAALERQYVEMFDRFAPLTAGERL